MMKKYPSISLRNRQCASQCYQPNCNSRVKKNLHTVYIGASSIGVSSLKQDLRNGSNISFFIFCCVHLSTVYQSTLGRNF